LRQTSLVAAAADNLCGKQPLLLPPPMISSGKTALAAAAANDLVR
jgi:hypothetical protein